MVRRAFQVVLVAIFLVAGFWNSGSAVAQEKKIFESGTWDGFSYQPDTLGGAGVFGRTYDTQVVEDWIIDPKSPNQRIIWIKQYTLSYNPVANPQTAIFRVMEAINGKPSSYSIVGDPVNGLALPVSEVVDLGYDVSTGLYKHSIKAHMTSDVILPGGKEFFFGLQIVDNSDFHYAMVSRYNGNAETPLDCFFRGRVPVPGSEPYAPLGWVSGKERLGEMSLNVIEIGYINLP